MKKNIFVKHIELFKFYITHTLHGFNGDIQEYLPLSDLTLEGFPVTE